VLLLLTLDMVTRGYSRALMLSLLRDFYLPRLLVSNSDGPCLLGLPPRRKT